MKSNDKPTANYTIIKWFGIFFLTTVLLQFSPDSIHDILTYHQNTFQNTFQNNFKLLWMWFTAHLIHLNWEHWALNILAFSVTLLLFKEVWTLSFVSWIYVISAWTVTLGLIFFEPNVTYYMGFSGVLHAYLIAGALTYIHVDKRIAYFMTILITLKVWYEFFTQKSVWVSALTDMPVVLNAHAYGWVGGILVFLFVWVTDRKSNHPHKL